MLGWFWEVFTDSTVKSNGKICSHCKPLSDDRVEAMPIGDRYPGLGDCKIIVSRETPSSEQLSAGKLRVVKFIFWVMRTMPLTGRYTTPYQGDENSCPERYSTLAASVFRPGAVDLSGDTLAEIGYLGPFSLYTVKREDGDYEIDMSALEALPIRSQFMQAGGRLVMTASDEGLQTKYIEGWSKKYAPGDEEFPMARARFLAGLNSYNTFVDHLTHCHLVVGGTFAVTTIEVLPVDHPLRLLIHPFVMETNKVNNYNIGALITDEFSNVPSYTGYRLSTLNEVMTKATDDFRFEQMDPLHMAEVNGVADDARFTTVESACALWKIILDYTTKYCSHYLGEIDADTREWVEKLDGYIANGVRDYLGIENFDQLTSEHIARLVAVLVNTVSVRHYLVGTVTRNYYLFPFAFPTVVSKDGSPPPLGVVMQKTNSIAGANVERYRLIDPSIVYPDAAGKELGTAFHEALNTYWETAIPEGEDRHYLIDPGLLMSSIHA